MVKIDKETVELYKYICSDYIYKDNNGHLRERYGFFVHGKLIAIEGNTNGFFIEEDITTLSGIYSWVNGA